MHPRRASGFSGLAYVAVLAFVGLGAATVYFAVQARGAEARLRALRQAPEPGAPASEPTTDASLRGTLWARDAELSRLRAENQSLRARLLGTPAAVAHDGGPAARPWLEQLKARDPERYKQMMERREQARIDRANELHTQLAQLEQRLEAIPPEGRTPRSQKEAELLTQMQSVIGQLEQLGDKFQQARQLPEGERATALQALQQQGADLYGQLVALKQQDRQMQLEQVAVQAGIAPENTQSFTKQVEQVVKDTQPPSRRGFFGGGGGPPPGAGGGSGAGGT